MSALTNRLAGVEVSVSWQHRVVSSPQLLGSEEDRDEMIVARVNRFLLVSPAVDDHSYGHYRADS